MWCAISGLGTNESRRRGQCTRISGVIGLDRYWTGWIRIDIGWIGLRVSWIQLSENGKQVHGCGTLRQRRFGASRSRASRVVYTLDCARRKKPMFLASYSQWQQRIRSSAALASDLQTRSRFVPPFGVGEARRWAGENSDWLAYHPISREAF